MAWFNPLSWGEKVVDNVLDKDNGLLKQFGSFINNQNLTDQEVMIQNAKTVDSVQQFVRDTLDENTERSKSRRNIVNKWIRVQLALILMVCICAPFNMVLAEFYFEMATCGLMTMGTTAIIIFHFGSHGIAKFKSKK